MAGQSDTRTTSQIEADLGATRDRLVDSVEALIDQVHPARIKQREVANLKRRFHFEVDNVKALVYNSRGDLRTDRIGALAGALTGLVGFVVIVRTIARRRGRV